MLTAKDPIYQECIQIEKEKGKGLLGLSSNTSWTEDPKRLVFLLSRYKFVAKMLDGAKEVIEIGCGDGFASRIVAQHVQSLTISDYDPVFIDNALSIRSDSWKYECCVHDILESSLEPKKFTAAYSLDVLEHFSEDKEHAFFSNICRSLSKDGIFIVGMPSINSQKFANHRAKIGHVNCKSLPELKRKCEFYFENCFGFSMNDEVVHTGFHEMANYILVLCCSPKEKKI